MGGGNGAAPISIELSKAQIDEVLRKASGVSFSGMIQRVLADTERLPLSVAGLDEARFSRSLMVGLLLLASFPHDGSYLRNGEVARRVGLNPSTSHRYIQTLVEVGLLERDPTTRRYRLPR